MALVVEAYPALKVYPPAVIVTLPRGLYVVECVLLVMVPFYILAYL
jgi:hypothetical protein